MISLTEERRPWPSTDVTVVIDTTVLIDFALETEPRHANAVELIKGLVERGVRILVPFHAAIEIMCNISGGVKNNKSIQSPHAANNPNTIQLMLHSVPINLEFMDLYQMADLPYMKAGDILFLALARAGGVPLITEDLKMYEKAKKIIGANAFLVTEYLEFVQRNVGKPNKT